MPNFIKVDKAMLYPQICFTCLGPLHDKECIDTGVDAPGENGRVYFCHSCIDDLAKATNHLTRDEASKIIADNRSMKDKIALLPLAVEGMKSELGLALDRVNRYLDGGHAPPLPDSPAVPVRVAQGSGKKPRLTAQDFDTVSVASD